MSASERLAENRKEAEGVTNKADKALASHLLARLGNPPVQLVLWDGETIGPSEAVGRVIFRDRAALWKLPLNINLKFGDLFCEGAIEIEGDLIDVIAACYRAMPEGVDANPLSRQMKRVLNPRRNTLRRAKENIHSHYDLGNEFYSLWLDPEMVYTCAYYRDDSTSLAQAQIDKMDYVCRKLRLQPGEKVVEAGCGWGSLARYMARHYGVKVCAYNISSEQIRYARERAEREGLSDRVEYIEDDYRNIKGKYDVFVSVGMLEHVGREHYKDLGEVINRCLSNEGRGLIHSVGRNRKTEMSDWIEKRIFPGSYVPSLTEMIGLLEPFNFSVLDVENLRLHYARTLRDWLERFDAVADRVRDMFDERFVRAWRLYLGGCSAAFLTGSTQLFQVVFARPNVNDIPWTRAHLYQD